MSRSNLLLSVLCSIVFLSWCQSSFAQFEDQTKMQTPDGVWSPNEVTIGQFSNFKLASESFSFEAISLSPRITSQQDYLTFVAGRDNLDIAKLLEPNLYEAAQNIMRVQQVVLGISTDLFPEQRYDHLRDSFSQQCIDAAEKLNVVIYGTTPAEQSTLPDAENMQQHLTEGHESIEATIKRLQALKGAITPEVINLVRIYDNQCLSNAYDTLPLVIKRAVGVLVMGIVPFCSATLIGDKKIVTARHCFLSSVDGKPHDSLQALNDNYVSFHPLVPEDSGLRPFLQVKANPLVPPANPEKTFGVSEDVVVLDLMYPMRNRALTVDRQLTTVEPADPIWVVGYNSYISLKEPLVRGPAGEIVVTNRIRFAPPETCGVLRKTQSGCLFHSCQSAAGTSGASLIKMEQGKASVIGIHKGAAFVGKGCGADDLLTETINVAASGSSIPQL